MNDDIILEPTLLRAVWRYRWLVLLIAVVATTAAWAYADRTATQEWSAESSVVAEDPLASIIFDNTATRREDYIADQVAFMESGTVTEKAAEIAPTLDPEFPYTAFDILERRRVVESDASITVRMSASTEEAAVAGANAMTQAYIELVQADAAALLNNSVAVLDSVIAELSNELDDVAARIEVAQQSSNPDLARLQDQYNESLGRLATLFDRLEVASDLTRDGIRAQIEDISTQLSVLERVLAIEGESSGVASLLEQQRRTIVRLDDLAEQRDRFRVDAQLLGAGSSSNTEAGFGTLVATDVLRLILAGAFLGLLIGSGLAYMLALRRRSITDRIQPELVLAAPLIAEVPNFRHEGIRTPLPVKTHPRSAAAESFRFAAAALDLSRSAPMGSIVTEGKLVVVTSASVADGKTVIAANTALAAAREGKRVLLIDADFGSQTATSMLTDERPESGITEVVESGTALSEAVLPIEGTGTSGLHLLSRGWQTTSAPEFFRNPATREFLDQIQEFYDLIILDGPPLLSVAYASTIAGMVDKVLVVTRHNSSATALEELQDRLDLVGTPTVGYVYNLAPLRLDISRSEGSMRDVLGQQPAVTAGDS